MKELIKINEFKKNAKLRYVLHIIFITSLLVLTIAGAVLLLVFSSLDYTLNQIIAVVLCVLVCLFTIFYFLNIFPIIKHYYSFYKGLNEVNLENRRRMVFNEKKNIKEIDNTKYNVYEFIYNEGETDYKEGLYVLDSEVNFEPGKEYKIQTYHNVIIRFEEI